jgi:hypothetical protein
MVLQAITGRFGVLAADWLAVLARGHVAPELH